MEKANLSEIFLSLQGEGLYIGVPQLFLRFSGCNLKCNFCDTPYAQHPSSTFKVYSPAGKSIIIKNPIGLTHLRKIIKKYKRNYHFLSITGGEPLMQVSFLEKFLKKKSSKIYLETNGVNYKELTRIINLVDIIAMDIKLPSSLSGRDYFSHHQKFLKIAYQKEVFVKIVLTKKTSAEEIKKATQIIYQISPLIPLILQPSFQNKIKTEKIFSYIDIARDKLSEVRVIPQMHKGLKIR